VVRNYAKVTSIKPGSPNALFLLDGITGRESRAFAHRVARAQGPWTDPELLVPSKGVHLVVPALPLKEGLLLSHARDGRVFFVVPWLGRSVVGTTETPFEGPPDRLRVETEEVHYLLDEVNRLFPGLGIAPRDILGAYAGVRPLARTRKLLAGGTGAVSRTHKIRDEGSGIVSVYGGKYTTYRRVAQEVVDHLFPGTVCTTGRRPLPGGEAGPWEAAAPTLSLQIARFGLGEVERLFSRYGMRLREVLALVEADRTLGEKLGPAHAELRAEAVYAIRQELVAYPVDFLERRTSMRWTADQARSAYDAVDDLIRAHAICVPPDLDRARREYFGDLEEEDRLRAGGAEPPSKEAP
jgi:glycerol-3-phosphate dehydrogenase